MKKSNLLLASLLGGLALSFTTGPAAAAETYKLDPMHTAVVWHVDHFGFSHPSGKFMHIDGTLQLDEKHPEASKVEVTIPIASVNTGVPELDTHLKTKDFFDAETYPTASFTSTKVRLTGKNKALVEGNLSLHGETKPVILAVTLNKKAENMFKKQTAGFTATAKIKRSDFGIKTYLPGLGDEVRLEIESEANLEAAEAAKN